MERPLDAHHVYAGNVAPGGAGRPDADDVAKVPGAAVDETSWHHAVTDGPLRAIAVGDEEVERHGALRQCAVDGSPLARREDPRHRVERKDGGDAFGGNTERDPPVGEPLLRVAADLGQGARGALEGREHLRVGRPDHAVEVDAFVSSPWQTEGNVPDGTGLGCHPRTVLPESATSSLVTAHKVRRRRLCNESGSHAPIRRYSEDRDRRPHERSTASRGL